MLISRRQKVGNKKFKNPNAIIDYLQTIDDVYENLEDYNPTKKRRVWIVLDDVKTDVEYYKRSIPIVTELFLRGRKLKVSFVSISQY